MDFGHLSRNEMISVPFELEWVEFGMLIPGIPLPEKFQKECGLNLYGTVTFVYAFVFFQLGLCSVS